MKPLPQSRKQPWQPTPVLPPTVDADFQRMSGLQRAAEAFRYVLLRWEHWVSPRGDMREWLRHSTRVGAWLFIPAIVVMPVVGLILWQFTGWLAMLTSIAGRLILILLAFFVIKTVAALLKR